MCLLGPSINGLVTDIQVNVYSKYVVQAELSKLTNVEVLIIMSPLFLSIFVIFLQKAMAQYVIF